MIKCEVIENFTLGDFGKLKNIVRNSNIDKYGELFVRDTFECDEDMANYLTGANCKKACVVKVLEVVPEIITNEKEVAKKVIEQNKPNKKKKSSKK